MTAEFSVNFRFANFHRVHLSYAPGGSLSSGAGLTAPPPAVCSPFCLVIWLPQKGLPSLTERRYRKNLTRQIPLSLQEVHSLSLPRRRRISRLRSFLPAFRKGRSAFLRLPNIRTDANSADLPGFFRHFRVAKWEYSSFLPKSPLPRLGIPRASIPLYHI